MMMLNPINYLKSGYKISGDIILDIKNQQIYSKMGSYYNGTKGCKPAAVTSGTSFSCSAVDFASTGLKNDITRNAIEEVIWNLGGSSTYSNVTASMSYERERGSSVYSGNATTWKGKIGLMYPSDYGYATSGGTTKDRSACLAKGLWNWSSSTFNDCKDNDYLYNLNLYQLTMTSSSANADVVFGVGQSGYVDNRNASGSYDIRPTLFLKSNISIKSGTGENSNPYQLRLE